MTARFTLADALRAGARDLASGGVPDPSRDARRLLAHVLGMPPERLTTKLREPFPLAAGAAFDAALCRRLSREPVSQITGRRLFWGRPFRVTRDTLDPRPETETLIAAALEAPFAEVLDLGTGTGAILLTLLLERPGATGLGTDLSEAALAVARGNAARLGARDATFLRADWFDGIDGRFDLIASNPPYIAAGEMAGLEPEVRLWEPAMALTDGGDGLAAYRAIAAGAPAHLAPGGRLMVEIGPTQAAAVAGLFREAGLAGVEVRADLDGRDRVVIARAPD
ncbi:peptide chain release factor N(5)-glutamine methyltransferase [Paracoccus sp. S-4012]|uniref:peptide chain release factor N(5)-glutamine methyltransferase n=1 Tax=Paracoccus sp. S-4012 TaxID=2665648 RepID=UPI0012B0172B|nr:peptide chain release factor N(5)-glutamine methyltransferase [Paracoccus sp. S-4012]MRX49634.1 peptide chain release factor N(5)-glutamine methyltransferase [Paracoccus sp. S-4012]